MAFAYEPHEQQTENQAWPCKLDNNKKQMHANAQLEYY